MDPDHDVCSVVNGPESSGVSDDFSKGSAGENHPIEQPNPSHKIFAFQLGKDEFDYFPFFAKN